MKHCDNERMVYVSFDAQLVNWLINSKREKIKIVLAANKMCFESMKRTTHRTTETRGPLNELIIIHQIAFMQLVTSRAKRTKTTR